MWNVPTMQRLDEIPRLYRTEAIPLKDKLVYLHFFIGGSDWYIAEFDGDDIFWGFAILNQDYEMAEWGYVSFSELKSLRLKNLLEVDCEDVWLPQRAIEIEKIRVAQGWPEERDCEHLSWRAKEERDRMIKIHHYVKSKGVSCPFCGSSCIQGGPVEVNAGYALQEMSCTDCEGRWEDTYDLVGFKVLQEGRKSERVQTSDAELTLQSANLPDT